jgi:hypothetical protein
MKAEETKQPVLTQAGAMGTKKEAAAWEPAKEEKRSQKEAHADQLKKILTSVFSKITPKSEIKPFSTNECVALEISDTKLFGYIVVSNRKSGKKIDQINMFKTKLQDSLLLYGRGLQITGAHSISLEIDDFPGWAEDSGQFSCEGKVGNENINAFFIEKTIDKPKREYTHQFLNLPLECVVEDEKPIFDIYMHLPVNDRTLKIFKKDFLAEGARLKKLKNQNVNLLYIKKTDEVLLDQYLAGAQIGRSLHAYQSKVQADHGQEVS